MDEGYELSSHLAKVCIDPSKVELGLMELFINAIEHGNLGIGFEEKAILVEKGIWHQEIEKRLNMPENIDKAVTVQSKRSEKEIQFFIKDCGNGFDWLLYRDFQEDKILENHGRGIAFAVQYCFDKLEYQGNGNEVMAVAKLTGS